MSKWATCSVSGCWGVAERKGLCPKHYQRLTKKKRKEEVMAKKETESRSDIRDPSVQKAQRGGSPSKAPHHAGEAGSGEMRDLGNRKFNKEGRDSVSEKEPGKSRGPGG